MTLQSEVPVITSKDGDFPFSRGLLTKSLTAAGLSVEEAYELSSQLHDRLAKEGKAQYTRSELREIVVSRLREAYGDIVADSYLESLRPLPHLVVKGTGTSFPFSKGLLTLSIQASGVNTETAFNVAKLVEAELMKSRNRTATRDQIRATTSHFLEMIAGREFARRYILWRDLRTKATPVIVLVGGGTGVGKSTLAAELGRYLGFMRTLSTDAIRQIMRTLFSGEFVPSIHESSYTAHTALDVPLPEGIDPVIFAFREQATRICVGVRAMIERAINEGVSMIIDGVHLVPGFLGTARFRKVARIVWLMIAVSDERSHREHFMSREQTAENRLAKRYVDNFTAIRRIQDYVLSLAKQHSIPVIENVDFDKTVTEVVSVVSDEIMRQDPRPEGD